MLEPRWRKMLRDAWLNAARSLLVILAVATAMTAGGALLDAWSLVDRATTGSYRASHPASATLHAERVGDAELAATRAVPGVRSARLRRVVSATVRANGARLPAELFALEDFEQRDIGRLEGVRGTWPPRDGEIAIENSSLEFSGAALGEPLAVQFGRNDERTLPVTGIARDVGLPPGWMDHVVYGFVTPATLARIGAPSSYGDVQILVDPAADRDA
ncbi:MAG TPA: hypothetical protein VFB32_07815, partial [Rudaea sp.]|nr:hypothetical protein [Rudaea sp.]